MLLFSQKAQVALCAFCASLLFFHTNGVAWAHASHWHSQPEAGATVAQDTLQHIVLELNEPVVLAFSVFELHKLEVTKDASPQDIKDAATAVQYNQFDTPTDTTDTAVVASRQALTLVAADDTGNPQAQPHTDTSNDAHNDPTKTHISTALKDVARAQDLVFALPEGGLDPGTYALLWRVLSIDTHITQDMLTFTVVGAVAGE